jgi:predicted homoserine dehydrogenase-like protein
MASQLAERARAQKPVRIGLIGVGKFGSMFLSQAPRIPGVHVVGIADLNLDRAHREVETVGWPRELTAPKSLAEAISSGGAFVTDDSESLIAADGIDMIVEATGNPGAGIIHALSCCDHRRNIVMVNVEADALAGPLLARRAREAGILYSFAYGDQPALIAELVDWARLGGFEVVCAGKGTKYLPAFRHSTPDTVWSHYGFTEARVAAGDFNRKMFNSFLDGTKSAIEMAAVANATGLDVPEDGLTFPPCGVDELPSVLRPVADGGLLRRSGLVEVVSSIECGGGAAVSRDLRWGVFVIFKASSDYARRCFADYGIRTDASGWYGAMYKPHPFIGLELGVSVASIALRGEPTGATRDFRADAVAIAKRDLTVGETLDGEGGYTVYGRLMPAQKSLALGALPIGLAHNARLMRPVAAGEIVCWGDCLLDDASREVRLRREMETMFRAPICTGSPSEGKVF